jgi:hypothetical protein
LLVAGERRQPARPAGGDVGAGDGEGGGDIGAAVATDSS